MAVAFEVLAEPNRRRILDLLRVAERPVGDLVDELALSQPAVSKHLRVLRESGFVEARADAQRRLYRVRAEPLKELDAWLEPYRSMWEARLDDLERHLDAMPDLEHEGGNDDRKRRRARRARTPR
jgi:DNA-binding transcriptional ArsR family regulator